MKYPAPTRAKLPPSSHVFVYDDDCGFCLVTARALQRWARRDIELLPFSALGGRGLLTALDGPQINASAHFVTPEGKEFHGGESVTRALRLVPGGFVFRLLDLPLANRLRDVVYGLVEANRQWISRRMGLQACGIGSAAGASDGGESRATRG